MKLSLDKIWKLDIFQNSDLSTTKKPVLLRSGTLYTFLILTLFITLGGLFLLNQAYKSSQETAFKELKTIGDLKADQISQWYSECIRNANEIKENSIVNTLAYGIVTQKSNQEMKNACLQWMKNRQNSSQYIGFSLFDKAGNELLYSPWEKHRSELANDISLYESVRQNRITITDLHVDKPDSVYYNPLIHMNIWIPISNDRGEAVGAWLVQIDPATNLYPLIQTWPTYSKTGESLIVRREGDDVVYLNELRHKKGTALKLRFSIDQNPAITTGMAVKGKAGVVSGKDYRGISVLSAIQSVDGTPWYLISKIDRKEIYEPLRTRIWTIWSFVLILIILVAMGVGYREKNRDQRWIERQFALSRERQQYAERIANLTKYANDIIFLLDKNWNIIDANLKAAETYGYTEHELKLMNLDELRIPTERGILGQFDVEVLANTGLRVEASHIAKDGRRLEVESSIRSLEIEGEIYLQAIIRDITDRKRFETEKHELTQRLQTIIDKAPFGAYTYSLSTDDKLILTGFNLSADKIKGIEHKSLLGKSIEAAFPGIANSDIPEINRRVIATGEVFERIEYTYRDSEIIEAYDVKTIKTGDNQVTAFFIDVTERLKAEKVIADNQERLNMSQAIGHVASWEFDILTGQIWSSAEGFKIFGFPLNETGALQLEAVEATIPERKRVNKALVDLITKELPYNLEYQINPYDGSLPRIVTSQAILVKNQDGKPLKVVGVIQDVTEKRKADELVNSANQRLKLATDAAKIGIWDWDLATNVLVWDDTMYELYGVDKEQFGDAYEAWLACIDPRDKETSNQISQRAVAGEIEYDTEFRIIWMDGSIHYIKANGIVIRDDFGKAIRMLGTNWDITKIKAIEENLRENQERLQMSQTIGHIGSWEIDLDSMQVWGSDEGLRLYGIPSETNVFPIGFFDDLILDKDLAYQALKDLINDGKPYDVELPILPMDGSPNKIVASKAVLVRDESGNPIKVEGVIQDITDRRKHEETILKQNRLLQDLHDVGLTLNRTLSLPEIFKTLNAFISQHLPYEVFIVNRLNREEDTIQYISYWMNNIQVDVSGMPKVPIRRDGTGLQSYVLLTGEAMLIHTKEEYEKRTKSNHHLSDNGKYLEEKNREKDAKKVESIILVPLIVSGQTIGLLQVMSLKPHAYTEDDLRLVEAISVHAASAMQNEELFTALEQSKEELEHRVIERTAQLTSANKDLEAFSYSVSHDLRTPLRGIDGWSAVLLEDYAENLDVQGKKGLETIREEAQHMGRLIDALLGLAKMSRGELKLREINLSLLAEAVVQRLLPDEPSRHCEVNIQPGLIDTCDPGLIDIVLTNLFSNALKFTKTRQNTIIEFGKVVEADKLAYFVKDNGVGFDMKHSNKLFGAFQRLHKSTDFAGTGIGLATVKRIITRHGGTVWAQSEPDVNTIFYFTLREG